MLIDGLLYHFSILYTSTYNYITYYTTMYMALRPPHNNNDNSEQQHVIISIIIIILILYYYYYCRQYNCDKRQAPSQEKHQ